MGRSTSCFKIITCASDVADQDDIQVSENKSSSDKRGWSFRKRSERHRILSNSVTAETPSGHKEVPESTDLKFEAPDVSAAPEKPSTIQVVEEKPQLMSPEDSKVCQPVDSGKDESEEDCTIDESLVVVIQTAIRGFLAQRELVKFKKVVKLQAAVRGHIVRNHAVGSLRCVQAIVKMQMLVRARHARSYQEGSYTQSKSDDKQNASKQVIAVTKPDFTYTSIQKLLSNRFARQLMDSRPKTKPINIKCDPSRPNSAWSWLERWMSVSSDGQTPSPEVTKVQAGREKSENIHSPVDAKIPFEASSESADTEPSTRDTIVPSEVEENMITYDADNFKFQACQPTPELTDYSEQPPLEKQSTSDLKEIVEAKPDTSEALESDVNSQTEIISIPHKLETESEQQKRSTKRVASEQLETEGKKVTRKASNPAFIAAQTKFEELSSTAISTRSISSSCQDGGIESTMDVISSETDIVIKQKDVSITETSVNSSRVPLGGSECGTELSISSTLDSPDRSEVGIAEHEHGTKINLEENFISNGTDHLGDKANEMSPTTTVPDSSYSATDHPGKLDDIGGELGNLAVAVEAKQVVLEPQRSTSDLQMELDSPTGHHHSPEASPRSHVTVPESQGTPSSQVSVKANKKKSEKSNQKRKSLSAGKSAALESGARSSMEQLPMDQKSGKRHSSFGTTKAENIEQEPRDSSGSSSLPHFMQATESARAKINANSSPRSSPDMQDRDIYIKKRHSLPGANGRQGSPRIQRSMSQAQQSAKGNGTNPLHERKWQR